MAGCQGIRVEARRQFCYIIFMATKIVPQTTEPPQPIETAEQRETRIRQEMALITKAHAEIDAGLGIGDDDVEAWLDQLDIDENAPMPVPESAARRH
jgi:hypothetical protein